jgi:hypothetical protein
VHTKRIAATNSEERIVVDVEDYPVVSRHRWFVSTSHGHSEALTYIPPEVRGRGRTISMQRLIMNPAKGQLVWHKNGNGLDNRRQNLVIADSRRHLAHIISRSRKRLYRGVDRPLGITTFWQANFAKKHLGAFKTAKEAALAYDFEARKAYREKAVLNFPDIVLESPPKPIPQKPKDSKYRGVFKRDDKWGAHFAFEGKNTYLGRFKTEKEAALAYDFACRKALGDEESHSRLNFPKLKIKEPPKPTSDRTRSSKFRGVSRHKSGWVANLSYGGTMKYLGVYKTEKEAALVYDEACRRLLSPKEAAWRLNFP